MIAILLSTYNGSLYLSEQLDSIFSQTFQNFVLYVRDDGSTDNTLEILKSYQLTYSNMIIIPSDRKNLGACGSFMELLSKVDADYYMFCDQDDVWLSSKVEICMKIMLLEEVTNGAMEILIHTDLIITDRNLKVLSRSLWSHDRVEPDRIGRKFLKVVNYVTGCTMFFNKLARNCALEESNLAIMHDYWLALSVDSAGGRIISLPFGTIFYRQHDKNTIGASSKKYRFSKIVRYLHIPNFKYSIKLFRMLQFQYSMTWFEYLVLRIEFFLKR